MIAKILSSKPELRQDRVFAKNFLHDLKHAVVKDLSLLDLTAVLKYITSNPRGDQQKKIDFTMYQTCVVDGKTQPVSNFKVEPPGIFMGMGSHPLRGKIKKRITPPDVTINISKSGPIPKPNVPGAWGRIVQDHTVLWIASWRQNVTGKLHHVWLGQESTIQMNRDREKYDLARKLSGRILRVRSQIEEAMRSTSILKKQLGTAVWIIDNLAIRVGNEKGDNEAQTVGVTSLLVKNISIDDGSIRLNFLGKDSVPYCRTVDVPLLVASNLKQFIHKKQRDDMIFDLVDSKAVNEYLHTLMSGLTAKVFRTMNASKTFQDVLKDSEARLQKKGTTIQQAFREYNMANVTVAELCNHQKKVNSTEKKNASLKKLEQRIQSTKTAQKKKDLKDELRLRKAMKNLNLGTSRQNYLDPRITVAFAKRMKVPVSKFFSKKLLSRFKWALDIEEDFVW